MTRPGTYMTTDEIRTKFLEFFEEKAHTVVPSASLVPEGDTTLLFTGAGMNQFKDYFLGVRTDLSRAASCQKCFRTDDIDEVGRTAYHHTFFEMLGNFSFGDYFKKEAIEWAWEFLVKVLGLAEDKLSASVYKDDDEAYDVWRNAIGLPEDRIYRFGDKDNFWPANSIADGPNGPCGPCSEIFYDFGAEAGCDSPDCDPSCDCDRYCEVWNLVFTQYNRTDGGVLEDLPGKSVDTGMGLERLAAVLQGVDTNFRIDILAPLVSAVAVETGVDIGDADGEAESRIRRIADHTRGVVFCIGDGILPANDGRGYVVRKILRRALGDAKALDFDEPFLYRLVPKIVKLMPPYSEISDNRDNIAMFVKNEEERFLKSLEEGTAILERHLDKLKKSGGKTLGGAEVFKLYDTYGLPLEETEKIAGASGFSVDIEGFKSEIEVQRKRSQDASSMMGDVFASTFMNEVKEKIEETEFVGYKHISKPALIQALVKDDELVGDVAEGDKVIAIANRTPFYAEKGGQTGDTGRIEKDGSLIEVYSTTEEGGYVLHHGKVKSGTFSTGIDAMFVVDDTRRADIAAHHTATHLLHFALREVLGPHATQSGSLVVPDRLRFDFTHPKGLSPDELEAVERIVNELIAGDSAVSAEETKLSEARACGAIALFGEKYGEEVRVIEVEGVSAELCGGIHVRNTGRIGSFAIVSEGSVAAGIRRIEAVAGRASLKYLTGRSRLVGRLSHSLGVADDELEDRVAKLAYDFKETRKEAERLKKERLTGGGGAGEMADIEIAGIPVGIRKFEGLSLDELRTVADSLKTAKGPYAMILTSNTGPSAAAIVLLLSPDLVEKGLSAVEMIKPVAAEVSGGGGGRPDMAQAGGKNPSGIESAIEKWKELVATKLDASRS